MAQSAEAVEYTDSVEELDLDIILNNLMVRLQ